MPVLAPPQEIVDHWGMWLWVFVERADRLLTAWPEARLTSWWRSPAHNARVGGHPRSRHLRGTAVDVVLSAGFRRAFIEDAEWVGLRALDEGDHVHVQDR